ARAARALADGRGHHLRRQGNGLDRARQAVAHGVERERPPCGVRRGGRGVSGPRGYRASRARGPSTFVLRPSRRGQRGRSVAAPARRREAAAPAAVDSAKARAVRRLTVRGTHGVVLTLAFDSTASGFLVHHVAGAGGEGATVYRMNVWDVDGVTPASRSLKK